MEENSLKLVDEDFEEFIKKIDHSEGIDNEKVREAYLFAKKSHGTQTRKTGEPYLIHPLYVAELVFDLGLDEASIISALLHDVVEDTDVTIDIIRKKFGKEVELIVDGITKINLYTESREEKSIETLRKMLLASAKDIRVILVKLCDRLHNMRTLEYFKESKRERIAKETILIFAPIAQKIGIYSLKWELEDLSFKYMNSEMYYLIKKKIKLKRNEREEIVQKGVEEIRKILEKNHITNTVVLGRPKNFYSIYKKVKDKRKSFEDIFDLYAIRIITKTIGDCYTILGILHEQFQAFPNRLKDYIANPKANGYQSLHTVIYSKIIKSPIEIQIRTDDMNKLAEYGVAAHWKYKNIKEDKKFDRKLSWLREVLQWEKERKDNQEFLRLLKYDFFQNEIFVFTPRNDSVFLPEDSSVIDFAYAIHTDIGNKAYKGKVNGIYTNLDKILKNGDIVEVITHPSAKPNEKWLRMVKTTKARIKIRDKINLKFKKKITKRIEDEVTFNHLLDKLTNVGQFKKIRKAGCCNLEYGDQVMGILGKNKELVVHNASCENAKYTVNKKIPLVWIQERKKEIYMSLIIKESFGMLIDVLNVFYDFNLTISQLNTKIQKDGRVKIDLKLVDGPYIDNLRLKLLDLDNVESVKVSRGFFG